MYAHWSSYLPPMHKQYKKDWEEYCASEIRKFTPLLLALGYSLDERQPHTTGERYLMQAVTTIHGRKLVLLGRDIKTDARVVLKVTSDPSGIEDLAYERRCRAALADMSFAYRHFLTPKELLFVAQDGYVIFIQEYLEQEKPFLELPIERQCELALRAFKEQEGAHATAYRHLKRIQKTFATYHTQDYLETFKKFTVYTTRQMPENRELGALLARAHAELESEGIRIEQYCNFLTHTDFVPHNFRVASGEIYLLDTSSIRFGNKYEGWARFLNYMTLYNPPLADALTKYVRENRSPEESTSLRLMRIFRLGELIRYYAGWLEKTDGNLHLLAETRIHFWSQVLSAVLSGEKMPEAALDAYKQRRDSLRNMEERQRQSELR